MFDASKILKISEEDWIAPLDTLDKEVYYAVGQFSKGNVMKMVSYYKGQFVVSDMVGVNIVNNSKIEFQSLKEAYEFFDILFN